MRLNLHLWVVWYLLWIIWTSTVWKICLLSSVFFLPSCLPAFLPSPFLLFLSPPAFLPPSLLPPILPSILPCFLPPSLPPFLSFSFFLSIWTQGYLFYTLGYDQRLYLSIYLINFIFLREVSSFQQNWTNDEQNSHIPCAPTQT